MTSTNDSKPQRERGIALIIALLVMVIMTLLGVPFLLMGETENRIAENERFSLQALYLADSGAKMVVRWFDRPGNANNVLNPTLAVIDRTQRKIDGDGNPATAGVQADGTLLKPWYKQGIDNDADGNDDVFMKPYRPTFKDTLMGTEDGPDMVIDETASGAAKTFLKNLSQGLFSNYPSAAVHARITRIDIYEPPYVQKSGVWQRFGMGTVKVVARLYKELPGESEEVLAERMVKLVINEIPYNQGDLGPLHSCDTLTWNGDFTIHWGIGTAKSWADLHSNHKNAPSSLPRVVASTLRLDLLWGWNDDAKFDAYKNKIEAEGLRVEDPWFRFIAGGDLVEPAGGSDPQQPWPFTWVPGTDFESGDIPYHPGGAGPDPYKDLVDEFGDPIVYDGTHSNFMQNIPVGCPSFPYEVWKDIARSGGLNVHYYVWDHDNYFKENGTGPSTEFRDITDNGTGLYFFDTRDGQPPHDNNNDGEFDNLTPHIKISGGTWGVRGMVYLNADIFQTHGVDGREAIFAAPGEPFQDKNANDRWDPGEKWIDLDYPDQLKVVGTKGKFYADAASPPSSSVRDKRGPPITDDALIWGIFYNSGYYDATGNGVYYGSMVAEQGIGEFGPTAGTPDHYWDQSLDEDWPPDEWGLPRVHLSAWETDL